MIKTLIDLGSINSGNLVFFKFRNSKFDLKGNFLNNLKTRMLADFNIPRV